MAWGAKASTADAFVARIKSNDEKFTALHAMPSRKFEAGSLAKLFAALPDATHLKELYLSGHALLQPDLEALEEYLPQNSSLVSISIGDAALGDDGAGHICRAVRGHATITQLDLSKKGLTTAGASALLDAAESLQEVTVAENPLLGEAGCLLLAEGLPRVNSLRVLDLAATECGPQGAAGLGKSLPAMTGVRLQSLTLACNPLGGEGVAALALGLAQSSLTELDLCSTKAGDAGAVSLAQCLKDGSPLVRLRLEQCGIGTEGAVAIAEALQGAKALAFLALGDNPLGPEAGAALGGSLSGACSLRELQVGSCSLGVEGVGSMGRAQNLTRLSLIGNEAGEPGVMALVEGLREGGLASLVALDLCVNQITVEAAVALLQAVGDPNTMPALAVVEMGGNPALGDEGELEEAVKGIQLTRPTLDVVWKKQQGNDAFEGM